MKAELLFFFASHIFFVPLAGGHNGVFEKKFLGGFAKLSAVIDLTRARFSTQFKIPILRNLLRVREALLVDLRRFLPARKEKRSTARSGCDHASRRGVRPP